MNATCDCTMFKACFQCMSFFNVPDPVASKPDYVEDGNNKSLNDNFTLMVLASITNFHSMKDIGTPWDIG